MPKTDKKYEKRHYSDKQKEFARFLYVSGDTLETISKRLNIPMGTLGTFSSAGRWLDARYPEISPDDAYQACLVLLMDELLKTMKSDDGFERGENITRAHKLTIMMRSIADIAPLRKATMQGFMQEVIRKYKKHPHLDEILRVAQEYHDALYSEETPAEV